MFTSNVKWVQSSSASKYEASSTTKASPGGASGSVLKRTRRLVVAVCALSIMSNAVVTIYDPAGRGARFGVLRARRCPAHAEGAKQMGSSAGEGALLVGPAVFGPLVEEGSGGGGGAGDFEQVCAVDVGEGVVAGGGAGDDELLVANASVVPFIGPGAWAGGLSGDVDRLAVLGGGDRVQAAAQTRDLPLLVGPAVLGPLLQVGALGGVPAGDVDDIASVPVCDVVGAVGQRARSACGLVGLQAGQQQGPGRRGPGGSRMP
jgi:hypothetical protein